MIAGIVRHPQRFYSTLAVTLIVMFVILIQFQGFKLVLERDGNDHSAVANVLRSETVQKIPIKNHENLLPG